jgi:tetratricopeptide (TPR) repeat protein
LVPLGLVLRVVSPAEAAAKADEDLVAATAAATAGDCAGAWSHYKNATRHRLPDLAWAAEARPAIDTAIAECQLAAAAAAPTPAEAHRALVAARRANRHHPAVKEATRARAAERFAAGEAARAAADWEAAYAAFHEALQLDPRLSWARRYAEEARDHRLGIGAAGSRPAAPGPAAPAAPAGEGEGAGDGGGPDGPG